MRRAALPRIARSALTGAAAVFVLAIGAAMLPTHPVAAGSSLESRKLPMRFSYVACEPNCGGFVSAVGIVTADSPKDFEDFARGRDLAGAAVVLDSSGGSVNDAIALGRRWRGLGMTTTVGVALRGKADRPVIAPEAYCESMCVFLLLSGQARYVPDGAHVRVHQIWMGDRADDARAASYTAQDMTIVERDIGRLAKYTFDMGGSGELLSLALSVPPWEELHELSAQELRDANLVTAQALAEVMPGIASAAPAAIAAAGPKTVLDRFDPAMAGEPAHTKTAEALPTGLAASPPQPAR